MKLNMLKYTEIREYIKNKDRRKNHLWKNDEELRNCYWKIYKINVKGKQGAKCENIC